jgi:hypothetical protein
MAARSFPVGAVTVRTPVVQCPTSASTVNDERGEVTERGALPDGLVGIDAVGSVRVTPV